MANILLLPNSVADEITDLNIHGDTMQSGFDEKDCIAGPRSTFIRFAGNNSNRRVSFEKTSTFAYDHIVIARADKLLTQNTLRLRFREDASGGGTYSTLSGADYNPITSSDLVGIDKFGKGYGQDLIYSTGSVRNARGVQVRTDIVSGSEARMYSKQVVSESFDFGTNPNIKNRPRWQPVRDDFIFKPQRASIEYECEKRITLTWEKVTNAKVTSFEALDQLLNWPLYLYDADETLWDWQLEHVIVEDYTIRREAPDINNVSVTFLRLRHYR